MNNMRIYAVETSAYCNASCDYCPHNKMTRELGYMNIETASKVAKYCSSIGQKYIALHHMGEPLLNPDIDSIIKVFKNEGITCEFSTNGLLVLKRKDLIIDSKLDLIRIAVDFFYNRPNYINDVNTFIEETEGSGIKIRLHTITGNDLSVFKNASHVIKEQKAFDNWAGSVEGESTLDKSNDCYFLKYNYCVVLWDGRIVPCCMDWDGKHIIGHIDNIHEIQHKDSYEICKNCAKLQFAEGGKWEK